MANSDSFIIRLLTSRIIYSAWWLQSKKSTFLYLIFNVTICNIICNSTLFFMCLVCITAEMSTLMCKQMCHCGTRDKLTTWKKLSTDVESNSFSLTHFYNHIHYSSFKKWIYSLFGQLYVEQSENKKIQDYA